MAQQKSPCAECRNVYSTKKPTKSGLFRRLQTCQNITNENMQISGRAVQSQRAYSYVSRQLPLDRNYVLG